MEVHDSRRGGGCKVHKNAELFNKQHNFLEEIQELKKWKNLRNLELTSNVKKHDIKISLREKDNFVLKGFKDLESNAYKRKTSILHVWIWGHYFQKREGHWTCISWKVKSICCLKHSLNFYLMRERLSVNTDLQGCHVAQQASKRHLQQPSQNWNLKQVSKQENWWARLKLNK